jgi:hypothetical protein
MHDWERVGLSAAHLQPFTKLPSKLVCCLPDHENHPACFVFFLEAADSTLWVCDLYRMPMFCNVVLGLNMHPATVFSVNWYPLS